MRVGDGRPGLRRPAARRLTAQARCSPPLTAPSRGPQPVTDDTTARRRSPPRPNDFPHHVVQTIRYRDLDPQSHVNNAVFATFFEAGRVVLLRGPRHAMLVPGASWVQARLAIDFLGEMHWPADVTIGTRVARLGTSSLTFGQALFVDDRCTALADSTVVLIDGETRRPRPLPEDLAARLRAGGGAVPEVD
ncbi:acyl-CoA thioesterase [Rhodoplanes serenus]|uniref:Acyl-CoA thioesterase n=1 Tax=Rhodoplanes serenus TaxID=200615 RepID=A0A9X5AUY1_9BRAD|nr:thioesterase family protein [Rhodoplanes serenus]MTW18934.1 acyl-CoA thioesterase [Rhodoplanes serenus]